MSKVSWPGPPAGVSTTDGAGSHDPVLPPGVSHRRQVGEDVLRDMDSMRKIDSSGGMNPAGAQAVKRDIREGPMPATRRSRRHHASFISVDGKEYTFRTHDTKGNQLGYLYTQVLYICLREIALGGSVNHILLAFNVNFPDETGKPFLPIPPASFAAAAEDYEQPEADAITLALGAMGDE